MKTRLSKNIRSVAKLENLRSLNIAAHLKNFSTLKRNYTSVDILNSGIKTHNKQDKQDVIKKQKECFTDSSITNPIRENKVTNYNDESKKNVMRTKMHKTENLSKNLSNVKPTASVKLERVTKSQFLKMHISETLFRDNKYLTGPYLHRISNAGDIDIFNRKKCVMRNSRDDIRAKDNVHCADAKYKRLSSKFAFLSEFNLAKSVSKFDKINAKLIDTQIDDLYTIFEDKCIKENGKDILK